MSVELWKPEGCWARTTVTSLLKVSPWDKSYLQRHLRTCCYVARPWHWAYQLWKVPESTVSAGGGHISWAGPLLPLNIETHSVSSWDGNHTRDYHVYLACRPWVSPSLVCGSVCKEHPDSQFLHFWNSWSKIRTESHCLETWGCQSLELRLCMSLHKFWSSYKYPVNVYLY